VASEANPAINDEVAAPAVEVETGTTGIAPASAAPRAAGADGALAPPVRPMPGSLAAGLLQAARPRQWTKNLLLLAAPFAAGVLGDGDVLGRVALAVLAFCLVASGTYLVNDARDADCDRRHPTKRRRPVAAGVVPPGVAVGAGALALLTGLGVAAVVDWALVGVVAAYVAMTSAYALWLRRVAVVDVGVVASGFILRAVAGGVAAGVPLSRWFLIVTSFASLFVVAGKRYGEYLDLGPERGAFRETLNAYSLSYLRYVWTVASGVAVLAYCLWAFERAAATGGSPWYELSIVPFTLSVLRYALVLDRGGGTAPEEIALRDRTLQVLGVAWVLVFGLGVYVGA
jgi:decaprenyl-phosphate phosphoribosyltransferase